MLQRWLRDSNADVIEGDRYIVHQNSPTHSLILNAKDGRGTILRQSHGYVVQSNLLHQDLKAIENLERKLAQQAAERVQSNTSINPKSQSRGFEVGD